MMKFKDVPNVGAPESGGFLIGVQPDGRGGRMPIADVAQWLVESARITGAGGAAQTIAQKLAALEASQAALMAQLAALLPRVTAIEDRGVKPETLTLAQIAEIDPLLNDGKMVRAEDASGLRRIAIASDGLWIWPNVDYAEVPLPGQQTYAAGDYFAEDYAA